MPPATISEKALSRNMLDVLIRAGLLAIMVIFCFRIFSPFMSLMLWSVILAITLYPLQRSLQSKLGRSNGFTATLIVLIAIGVLIATVCLLGQSLVDSVEGAMTMVKTGSFQIPLPPETIAHWPLVGKLLHSLWMQAVTDLPDLIQKYLPEIKHFTLSLLSELAGAGMGFLMFIVALMIAGILMAFGESGGRSAVQIVSRICGPAKGPKITSLCTTTIRAVALGVIGIAFIQMLLVGAGFVVMGVPGAGLLALVLLLLGIMQLPATLVTVPVIIYVFASEGASTVSVVFAIYVFIAGLVDNVLKPMLLGRGVDVPMPVVLVGALGGMISGGIIGLFIGPVLLAVSYQLFWQWVKDQPRDNALDDLGQA